MSTFTLIGKVVGYSRGGHQEGKTPKNILGRAERLRRQAPAGAERAHRGYGLRQHASLAGEEGAPAAPVPAPAVGPLDARLRQVLVPAAHVDGPLRVHAPVLLQLPGPHALGLLDHGQGRAPRARGLLERALGKRSYRAPASNHPLVCQFILESLCQNI